MRVCLRPYHPTYVLAYVGRGLERKHKGFNAVIAKIAADPATEVEIVEAYDDVCLECPRLEPDPAGSVWGPAHSCTSSRDPEIVRKVDAANRKVLGTLGLAFGDVVRVGELVEMLSRHIPSLDDKMIGGPGNQTDYEKGMALLKVRWAAELRIRPHHLLCMLCTLGRKEGDSPPDDSGSARVLSIIRANPDIRAFIAHGCDDVCASCSKNVEGRCTAESATRDLKKDRDTRTLLGVSRGDVRPVRELFELAAERIPRVEVICTYPTPYPPIWRDCSTARSGCYERAVAGRLWELG